MSTNEKQFDDSVRKKLSEYKENAPLELWEKIAWKSSTAFRFNFFNKLNGFLITDVLTALLFGWSLLYSNSESISVKQKMNTTATTIAVDKKVKIYIRKKNTGKNTISDITPRILQKSVLTKYGADNGAPKKLPPLNVTLGTRSNN